ncbi:MAG: hypothetical protein KUG77_05385 [Nannocystaceae bacterium]|nr:hypothetical protein [Nannocystaceae bacterium]
MSGLVLLLLIGTLTQGVTYEMDRRAQATENALSRAGQLGAAAADVEAAARRVERTPSTPGGRDALDRSIAELDEQASEFVDPSFDPSADEPGWGRVALALKSVTAEAHAIGSTLVVEPRAAQRLRARAVGLRDEADAAREQVEFDARQGRGRLRWLSWGSWAVLLASMLGVSRWVFSGAIDQLDRDGEDLAEAERAVLDAADGERARLGQELHDGLCQQLGGLRLLATAAQRGSSEPSTQESLSTLEDLAGKALDMARALSHGLYPGDVRAENLAGALERLGAEVAELGGCEFSFDGPAEALYSVSDADAMQLYRIAQEALSNAARHGNPRCLRVSLLAEPLTLRVEDDGVGLSSTHDGTTTAGVGLSSMHARARAMDARIKFFSTPQEGTRIVVTRAERTAEFDVFSEIPVTPLTPWTRP